MDWTIMSWWISCVYIIHVGKAMSQTTKNDWEWSYVYTTYKNMAIFLGDGAADGIVFYMKIPLSINHPGG